MKVLFNNNKNKKEMETTIALAKSRNYIYIGRRLGFRKLDERMGEEFTEVERLDNISPIQTQMFVRCAWSLLREFRATDIDGIQRQCIFMRCAFTERMLDQYINDINGILLHHIN